MKTYSRLLIFAFLSAFLFASPLVNVRPVLAGAQRWSAWAYQPDTRTAMLFTDVQTTPDNYVLPLPIGMTRIQGSIAVSHGWQYLSYVASTQSGNRRLVIYDRNTRTTARTITLPLQAASSLYSNQYDWQATEDSFNAESSSIAFGYALGAGGWLLDIFDIATGTSIAQLSSEAAPVRALSIPGTDGWTPVVQRYSGTQIVFTMANGSTTLPTHYDSYLWDTAANTVSVTTAYQMVNTDTLRTTGETVSVGLDVHYPRNANPGSTNIVMAFDPAAGTSIPFFTTAEVVPTVATFIQNGERVIVGGFVAPSPQLRYTILERSGNIAAELSTPDIGDVIGWQDGLLYLRGIPGSTQSLYALNTRSGLGTASVAVWTSSTGAPPLRLLQTPSNMQPASGLAAWGHITIPTISVTPTRAPSATPATSTCPTPRLSVGGQGRVTPGAANNVRSSPTGSVIGKIPAGAVFDVLEGPTCASNGILWWKINYNGMIGYTGEGQGSTYWVDPVS